MSLVDTFPYPPPHQFPVRDGVVVPVSISFVPTLNRPMSLEERWATQLANLASQHHTSEYNRLKFGPQGCPMVYVPLSIQMPAYVQDLKTRQAMSVEQKAWWPCHTSAEEHLPIVFGPCGTPKDCPVDLQQEISAAIAAPLTNVSDVPLPQPSVCATVKTSGTHPIK